MFQRILIAADNLGRSSRALYVARQLAHRAHAQLIVLHVEPESAVFDLTADERELRAVVGALRDQGIEARFVLDFGRPETRITETAVREHVDLVLMAPHHRDLLEAIRRPSVTQYVLAQGSAPVLAWPQHLSPELDAVLLHTSGSLVIVPLDGSARSEEALPLAAELAARFGRGMLLVRILPAVRPRGSLAEPDSERPSEVARGEQEVRSYLAQVRERLGALDVVQIETMVKHGDPVAEIAHTAELHPGSVIVMGTRGRGELARLVLGSVTEGVISRAPVPVLIVPPNALTSSPTIRTVAAL